MALEAYISSSIMTMANCFVFIVVSALEKMKIWSNVREFLDWSGKTPLGRISLRPHNQQQAAMCRLEEETCQVVPSPRDGNTPWRVSREQREDQRASRQTAVGKLVRAGQTAGGDQVIKDSPPDSLGVTWEAPESIRQEYSALWWTFQKDHWAHKSKQEVEKQEANEIVWIRNVGVRSLCRLSLGQRFILKLLVAWKPERCP